MAEHAVHVPSISIRTKAKEESAYLRAVNYIRSSIPMLVVFGVWFGLSFAYISIVLYAAYDCLQFLLCMISQKQYCSVSSCTQVSAAILIPYWIAELSQRFSLLKENKSFWNFLHQNTQKFPYFESFGVVFDGYEETESVPICADGRNLFVYHPHGITTIGWIYNGILHPSFAFLKVKWLVGSIFFMVPGLRNFALWTQLRPAQKLYMKKKMALGQNLALLPGGYEDATHYKHNQHTLYLARRTGFIKLALEFGYSVYPVYTFGEEKTYRVMESFLSYRLWLNRLKIPGVIFSGPWFCPPLPFPNVHLITVVGKPLVLPRIEHPTAQDVQKYHTQYIQALQTLFDRSKTKYGQGGTAKLVIV